ncbi:MAG TPA: hypothetical protein PLD77_02890 [Candidatus Dojkabacteria bacterium]|nr:hypothetical protein [Candidatus Dojkabacteria bacterium]
MLKKVLCRCEVQFDPENWSFNFPIFDIGEPFLSESDDDQIKKEFICGSKTIDGETLFYGKLVPIERLVS